jgi:hypothetical protein
VENPFALNGFAIAREGFDLFVDAFCFEGFELSMYGCEPFSPINGPLRLCNRLRVGGVVVTDTAE